MTKGRTPALLPRLASADRPAVAVWNGASLLSIGVAGAALVHLLAYHAPRGIFLSMAGVVIVLLLLLIGRELRRLEHLCGTLTRRLSTQRIAPPSRAVPVPRSPGRLLLFVLEVLALQVALMCLVGLPCPLQTTVSGGPPALPLALLHLMIAAVLGLFLWHAEQRLMRLRAVVSLQQRLLALAGRAPSIPLAPRAPSLPSAWHGATLFARPPPAAALS